MVDGLSEYGCRHTEGPAAAFMRFPVGYPRELLSPPLLLMFFDEVIGTIARNSQMLGLEGDGRRDLELDAGAGRCG